MKIRSVNAIREFTRLNGKQYSIQTPKQVMPKLKEALCITKKELALFQGYPKDHFCHHVIDIKTLESDVKGGGTRAIQKAVRTSLADPETEGRVTLVAAKISNSKPHPFNFYYKLGFRSTEDYFNEMGAKGVPMYPEADIFMYLPKENVEHCLNYKTAFDGKSAGLTYAYDIMR